MPLGALFLVAYAISRFHMTRLKCFHMTRLKYNLCDISVYDDYKFLTRRELEDLGLTHLIGSNLLRAYMHGFFIDIRLYHKVGTVVLLNPAHLVLAQIWVCHVLN